MSRYTALRDWSYRGIHLFVARHEGVEAPIATAMGRIGGSELWHQAELPGATKGSVQRWIDPEIARVEALEAKRVAKIEAQMAKAAE